MLNGLLKSIIPKEIMKFIRIERVKLFGGGYFGLNGLDKKLEKYVDYEHGFFVELGANDGFSQSNSYYFELKRGWQGVLIEPSPHNFLACYELRGKRSKVHCNACVGYDYTDRFVEIDYANLMSVSKGLDLDLESAESHIDTAQKHLRPGEKSFSFGAIAKPLSDILDESNAPAIIDFLSLDVEGAELEVLKGVDFSKHKFKFILVECRDIERLRSFLEGKGYSLSDQFSRHDYLFSSLDL